MCQRLSELHILMSIIRWVLDILMFGELDIIPQIIIIPAMVIIIQDIIQTIAVMARAYTTVTMLAGTNEFIIVDVHTIAGGCILVGFIAQLIYLDIVDKKDSRAEVLPGNVLFFGA